MEESMDSGTSVIDCTSWMVLARIAGSSASGMPALTSSMCAPAASCASVSDSTRLKLPAAISAASTLRPVGLMRSPIMTNGRSKPITTSRVAELMTVSVMSGSLPGSVGLRVTPGVPGHAAVEYPGALDDLGDGVFLAERHDVHAVHALDGADLLDEIDAQLTPFGGLVLRAAQARDHGVRNVHAGHVRADPLGRLGRAQRAHADQDEHLVEQPQLVGLVHEGPQQRYVVAELRLDELCAGGHLLRQSLGAPFERLGEGILGGAEQHARRVADLAAGEEVVLVAQRARGLEQRERVQ